MERVKGNSLLKCLYGLFAMVLLLCPSVTGRAGTIYESPYVTWTPDHSAWTVREVPPYTDLWLNYKKSGTKPEYWYPKGETYSTGIESAVGTPAKGQHLYTYERHGEVPVGKWVCEWSDGRCIHPSKLTEFGGFKLTPGMCGNAYYSGWMGYCADCDACVKPALMYMSRDAVKSLTSIDVDRKWAYICPHCNNLENALTEDVFHTCKKISWNQYLVHYDSNIPGEEPQDAEESIHMYNNAEEYNGYAVTAVRRLNANIFTRMGYTFAGWSLTPTGPVVYEDKAEILNLCDYDWREDRTRGTVTLYAQWVETRSTLKIDPAGGTYEGKSTVTSLEKGYGESYVADASKVAAPKGHRISFDTNGGNAIAPITGKKEFFCWRLSHPFAGVFDETTNTYIYEGAMGAVDTLTADYVDKPIILPTPSKSDENFGGWYEDAACTIPAGFGGEEYVPSRDITLYASWADLTLYSTNNMSANDKKGAVDLRWAQKDAENKVYLMYQSEDNENFKQIFTASEVAGRNNVDKSFAYKGARETYTVQYSGLYTLSASGAQGGDYNSYKGGKGGSISGKFYLQKGDVLTIHVGGQNGYNGGGKATKYGTGGGATTIASAQKGVLLVAGGGGGASLLGNGGDGGLSTSLTSTSLSGEEGMAGGGGGYLGGHAGSVVYHAHNASCGQHTHKGNPVSGGLCYQRDDIVEQECHVTTRREEWICEWPCVFCGNNHFYCWGWVGVHDVCTVRDYTCMQTNCTVCGAEGDDTHRESWGRTDYHNGTHIVKTNVGYKLTCTIPEGFLCGKTEATVKGANKQGQPPLGGAPGRDEKEWRQQDKV